MLWRLSVVAVLLIASGVCAAGRGLRWNDGPGGPQRTMPVLLLLIDEGTPALNDCGEATRMTLASQTDTLLIRHNVGEL